MIDFLTTLLNSLNSIEVKGKDNLDTLLACIAATEHMINTLNKPTEDGETDV